MSPKRPKDIDKQRAEIMRLIAKVNVGERPHTGGGRPSAREPAAPPHRHGVSPSPASPAAAPSQREPAEPVGQASRAAERTIHKERLETRRAELSQVRNLRKRLEAAGGPNSKLFQALQALENRMAGIEELMRAGGGIAAPAAPALDAASQASQLPAAEYDLSGVLREGLLADMLQLVSSNVMSGEFVVADQGSEVHLYFFEGEICHADGPDMYGESAVFAAMAVEEGRYYFRETNDIPEDRTIESKTQFLILEALRRVDEDRAS